MMKTIFKKIPVPLKLFIVRVWAEIFRFILNLSKPIRGPRWRMAFFKSIPREQLLISSLQETYVITSSDQSISPSIYIYGSFDFDKFETSFQITRSVRHDFSPEIFIDIGANIGPICIPVINRGFFPHAIAIEPDPLNYRLLTANIYLNNIYNEVEIYNMALGEDENSEVELVLSDHNYGDHRIIIGDTPHHNGSRKEGVVRVKSTRLDSIVANHPSNGMFLWMDVQGFEGYVLSGAEKTLSERPPLVVEISPAHLEGCGRSYEKLKEAALRAGYKTVYDLSEDSPQGSAVSEDALNRLYRRAEELRTTDALFL